MPSKINLYFETFREPEFDTEIIRLKTYAQFKSLDTWTEPYEGIIDSGAHTSILPLSLWKKIRYKSIKKIRIQGISPRPECSIPAIKAKVKCRLLDEDGNTTEDLEAISYLALTDEIPLIIGFRNIMAIYKVCFDYSNKEASLQR